jgi:hypothetical protein
MNYVKLKIQNDMKKLLILVLFVAIYNMLYPQDVMIINNQDSLDLKVLQEIPFDSINVDQIRVIPFDSIEMVLNKEKSDNNALTVQSAKLHFYRPSGVGALVGYDIYLDDDVICRSANNWKTTVDVSTMGKHTIWAKTESRAEIPITITAGGEYYIRCGMKMGIVVGRPSLELVDAGKGEPEYRAIKEKKSKK